MSTDEYLIGSGAPMKSNAINYTSDDDDPRGENAVMGLLSNSQFIRRMDWRKKFNEKCKTITIPKLRDPRKKSQNTIYGANKSNTNICKRNHRIPCAKWRRNISTLQSNQENNCQSI